MEIVRDECDLPRSVKEVHFNVLSADDVRRLSVLPIRKTIGDDPFGINDGRMGVCDKTSNCATCGLKFGECIGHPGHINLELPVFHVGFFIKTLQILRTICKVCARVMLEEDEKKDLRRKMSNPKMDGIQRAALAKKIQCDGYKVRVCMYCGSLNGVVRKLPALKLVHEKYATKTRKNEEACDGGEYFKGLFETAVKNNSDIKPHLDKVQEFLDPLRARELLRMIPKEDVILLGMEPNTAVKDLVVSSLLVPPVCVRPHGPAMTPSGIRDDDLTILYAEVLQDCDQIKQGNKVGMEATRLAELWDHLQLLVAQIFDGSLPGFPKTVKSVGRVRKAYAQRMKGKHGRFRGNLSGKRVNFSGRSVISPDPNLEVDELGLPERMAKVLSYPQMVFEQNMNLLRQMVRNGPNKHPGAHFLIPAKNPSMRINLLRCDRVALANNLQVGDVVERHIVNGDLILFNRQPSLHRLSMMCHKARVLPYRTLRFNECCCSPYNADFDGDEMNVHVVQTEEARAEAHSLMMTTKNLITARNGEPIIAATQDFLTGSYLLSSRDTFLTHAEFVQCLCHFLKSSSDCFVLPPPAILKPRPLWTGKQLFGVLVDPRGTSARLCFEGTARSYTKNRHMCKEEGYISFVRSTMISGRLDKRVLGGGSKETIFARLTHRAGGEFAGRALGRLARMTSRWLANYGFSFGISDVRPSDQLTEMKHRVLNEAFVACDSFIELARRGRLDPQPGCTIEKTLENKLNSQLSKVREECGSECIKMLPPTNTPLIMALSGSKGSNLNIGQMVTCVGQQIVNGKRIGNAFLQRSLPHFKRMAQHPAARGFVSNSFYTGLTPTEFFFHTMAGREGLVDTAVKTAETGYIYRRLMKALEDLCVQYDHSVRNSKADIIQLHAGEDSLDPLEMEGSNFQPVNFNALWMDFRSKQHWGKAPPLLPRDVVPIASDQLKKEINGCRIKPSPTFQRQFMAFIETKAKEIETARKRLGLPPDSFTKLRTRESWYATGAAVDEDTLRKIIRTGVLACTKKICPPGTAAGAIAAQSIGEPSTQMTLRTFHFAGVASMNITQGVPRLVEIINANKNISTPIIRVNIENSASLLFAKVMKAKLEKTLLRDVIFEIAEVLHSGKCYLSIALNRRRINELHLDVTSQSVRTSITAHCKSCRIPLTGDKIFPNGRDSLMVHPYDSTRDAMLFTLKKLKVILPDVVVAGVSSVNKAVVNKQEKTGQFEILADGADLQSVMNIPGVVGTKTTCNHVATVERVLGIEAARSTIISEISAIMTAYSLNIDVRHVFMIADVMTHKGKVLGITRHGIQKMNNSVLTMASFERTTEHLYDAAVHQRKDTKLGVSETVIVGSAIPLGTGCFQLLHKKSYIPPAKHYRPLLGSRDFHIDVIS